MGPGACWGIWMISSPAAGISDAGSWSDSMAHERTPIHASCNAHHQPAGWAGRPRQSRGRERIANGQTVIRLLQAIR